MNRHTLSLNSYAVYYKKMTIYSHFDKKGTMLFTEKSPKRFFGFRSYERNTEKNKMFFSPKFCQFKKSIYICREVVKLLVRIV